LIIVAWMFLATALQAQPAQAPSHPMVATTPTTSTAISTPDDGDAYSKLVQRAQSGDQSVDFLALRHAYLGSPAAARARTAAPELNRLRDDMSAAVKARDGARVRNAAVAILALDYLDLDAHKYLRQSCAILKDEPCASRHHFIELGLLESILSTGDGHSCATAWNVVTVAEEYFVLGMRGYTFTRPKTDSETEKICDRLDVVEDETGAVGTVFFDITALLDDQSRALPPK